MLSYYLFFHTECKYAIFFSQPRVTRGLGRKKTATFFAVAQYSQVLKLHLLQYRPTLFART